MIDTEKAITTGNLLSNFQRTLARHEVVGLDAVGVKMLLEEAVRDTQAEDGPPNVGG